MTAPAVGPAPNSRTDWDRRDAAIGGGFLAALPSDVRRALGAELAPLSLPGGCVLFSRGDPGDSLFVLLSGRLAVLALDATGRERMIAELGPGETVGEMALLSQRPRSATVVALRHCELARLDRAAFERLVAPSPDAVWTIARLLADRLAATLETRAEPPPVRTAALVALDAGVGLSGLTAAIAAQERGAGREVAVIRRRAQPPSAEWLHALERAHDLVIYEAEAGAGAWARLCVGQADHVLLVTADPHGDAAVAARLDARLACDLLLLVPETEAPPERLRCVGSIVPRCRWNLDPAAADFPGRLRRIVLRRAVAVVLSGGGARGFCHLGVLRALGELGIPVDILAGASMGALIAASAAMDWPLDEIRARLVDAFIRTNPIGDLTLPFLALTRGARLSSLLRRHFGQLAIEQLRRPFLAAATNLTSGQLSILREGPVVGALRATLAIPGLVPPVVVDGEVLADGGMLDNLPVAAVRALARGPIVAVDVGAARGFTLPSADTECGGLRWRWRHGNAPGIVSLLLRAATIGGDAGHAADRIETDVLIRPPAETIGLLDWRAMERAEAIGYRATMMQYEQGAFGALAPGKPADV